MFIKKAALFAEMDDGSIRKVPLTEGQMSFILESVRMLQGGDLRVEKNISSEFDFKYPEVVSE